LKVSDDVLQAKGEMPGDVLEEAPFGADLGDDAGDIGPEVARIRLAFALPREGKRLAGITGSDDMNASTPRTAIEGFEIVPDRSRSQGRIRHPCHESGRGETVSLDITGSSICGFCEVKAEIESGNTGAKADAEKRVMSLGGTNSHTRSPFLSGSAAGVQCGHAAQGKGSDLASSD
jgi:hypothetical protein